MEREVTAVLDAEHLRPTANRYRVTESPISCYLNAGVHNLMMKLLLPIALLSIIVRLVAAPELVGANSTNVSSSSVVGILRLHQLSSRTFGNERTIRVLLPPGYADPRNDDKRYPVLYLNDGQNLFDVSTSLFNPLEWQIDEAAARLVSEGKSDPIIIVGIDNAGRSQRPNEYLPYADRFLQPPVPSPEGKRYPEFLIEEVMPFINARYRTRTDPESTGIGGSSYGAVAALYAVLSRPGVFGRLLLESPSLYIADGQLLKDSAKQKTWPSRIYIGVGTNEEERAECRPGAWNHEAVQDVLRLRGLLQSAGLKEERLKVVVEDCARHDEAAWARRFPAALAFLYGKR